MSLPSGLSNCAQAYKAHICTVIALLHSSCSNSYAVYSEPVPYRGFCQCTTSLHLHMAGLGIPRSCHC